MSAESASSTTKDITEGFVPIYITPLRLKCKGEDTDGKKKKNVEFKILVRQPDDDLESVRFQIANDKELNFMYESTYDKEAFEAMKESQGLEIEFSDFPNVVRQEIATFVKQEEAMVDREQQMYKVSFSDQDEEEEEESEGEPEAAEKPAAQAKEAEGEAKSEEEEEEEEEAAENAAEPPKDVGQAEEPAKEEGQAEAPKEEGAKYYFVVYQRLPLRDVQILKLVFT